MMAKIGLIDLTDTANELTSRDVSMDRNALTRDHWLYKTLGITLLKPSHGMEQSMQRCNSHKNSASRMDSRLTINAIHLYFMLTKAEDSKK